MLYSDCSMLYHGYVYTGRHVHHSTECHHTSRTDSAWYDPAGYQKKRKGINLKTRSAGLVFLTIGSSYAFYLFPLLLTLHAGGMW